MTVYDGNRHTVSTPHSLRWPSGCTRHPVPVTLTRVVRRATFLAEMNQDFLRYAFYGAVRLYRTAPHHIASL